MIPAKESLILKQKLGKLLEIDVNSIQANVHKHYIFLLIGEDQAAINAYMHKVERKVEFEPGKVYNNKSIIITLKAYLAWDHECMIKHKWSEIPNELNRLLTRCKHHNNTIYFTLTTADAANLAHIPYFTLWQEYITSVNSIKII